MAKCKHDMGWLPYNDTHIFIWKDGKVSFAFQGLGRKTYKIKVRCNYPDCDAERNIYLIGKVVKWGKIKRRK